MAIELKDLRAKITPEADAVLEAFNRVDGKDKSEIVRDVLHSWALEHIRRASLMDSMLRVEGLPGIVGGTSGNLRDKS